MKFYDRVNEMQILQENEVQAERYGCLSSESGEEL